MRESKRFYHEQEMENAHSGKPRAAYHKFFEGYTEAKVSKKNGHGEKIIRCYTAPWKQPNLSRREWIWRKLAVAVLSLAAASLVAFAIFHGAATHNANYIVLLEMLAILSMLLLIMPLLTYFIAGYRMTLWEYKSGSRNLILFGKIASALAGLTGTAILIHTAITEKTGVSDNLLSAAAAICACVLLIILISDESRMEYLDIPNDTPKPENGREIWLE